MGKKSKDSLDDHSPVTLHVSASQHFFDTAAFPGAETRTLAFMIVIC